MLRSLALVLWLLCAPFCFAVPGLEDSPPPETPAIAKASDEGEKAIKGFRVPSGFKAELFAAEPQLANPVAFCFDEKGRVYVCETFRQGKGVEDNRGHGHWLDDDLAAMTVADRIAYIKKHLKAKAADYEKQDDRIRLLEDTDGDGRADKDTVFADGFNRIEDGTGAGVLAYRGDVFFTCIPKLWLLRDNDNDGKADLAKPLQDGYGVRFAFRGHDMHGLVIGPDGRLYFSIGDRGLNVQQGDKHFVLPECGAVMRCELDGSNLELFATGLRNPQELAFDDYGNLFTGDNNSDSGDQARWVYVVEGGDTGWRMYYQYLGDRGPFNREKIWHKFHEGQPAYIVPPIAAGMASGPSGLTYDTGTGLSEHFRRRFFLCDFRGGPNGSGVRTFRMKPKGAGFELVDAEESFWNILATDCEIAPDGGLYISDWVNGWNGEGKGRLYRFADADVSQSEIVKQVKQLLAEGLGKKSPEELQTLLGHADRRVRQESQFELVRRKEMTPLVAAAKEGELLPRLHGVWGLAQLARQGGDREACINAIVPLLEDSTAEVRAQAASVLGDLRVGAAAERFAKLTTDDEPRVRYFAAIALGKVNAGVDEAIRLAADNADQDPYLRHAAIMGLVGAPDEATLVKSALAHASPSVRLATVVALRKRKSLAVAEFLNDVDPKVVVEAARAIHDTSLTTALPKLAALIARPTKDDALLRRVLNAHYRLGGAENATALVKFALKADAPENMRLEALAMLDAWADPSPKDRVDGLWRPLDKRSGDAAAEAVKSSLPALLAGPEKIRNAAAKTAAKYGVQDVGPALIAMFEDSSRPAETRAEALVALSALKEPRLEELRTRGLEDKHAEIRIAARGLVAKSDLKAALPLLKDAVEKGEFRERQAALGILATSTEVGTNAILEQGLDELLAEKFPKEAALDLIEAAEKRAAGEIKSKTKKYLDSQPKDELTGWRETLVGGDAARGKQAFFEKTDLSCVRCHKIGGIGGDVGPDLSQIGKEKSREYLLESILVPNKAIAKNFESALVIDDNDVVHSGVVKFENDDRLDLMTAEGKLVSLKKSSIEERRAGKSPMPEDLIKKMTKRELRDLVEFLKGLGAP